MAADILQIVECPNAEALGRNFLRPLGVFDPLRKLGIKQRKVRRRGLPKPSAPSRRINLTKGHFNVSDRVLVPHVPKGQPPYSGPVQIGEILSYFTFRLSDGRVCNARRLKRNEMDPALPHPPVQGPRARKSQRRNHGVPPVRYSDLIF
ncbi:MAG: hypothetical protein GY696_24115 [Gammaproteobacteria bacterium]|nr:hypothetical protein [Gammaproteobacteria bacterium]